MKRVPGKRGVAVERRTNQDSCSRPVESGLTIHPVPWFPVTTSPAGSAIDGTGSGDTKNTHGRFEQRRDKYVSAHRVTVSPAASRSPQAERAKQPAV